MGLEELRRIREDRDKPKEKKIYRLNKVSPKTIKRKAKQEVEVEAGNELVDGDGDLKKWFESRRNDLIGICAHCGGRSCKDDDKYFKFSIAHILPKNVFKSVRTHPLNFIELCFWGNSCHTNFDNKTLDIMDMSCFSIIIDRFVAMYPSIDPKERRYIPDILLQYMEVEK